MSRRVGELPTSRRVTRERATMRLAWPLGPTTRPVVLANNYGEERHRRDGTRGVHKGVDMVAPAGTEIRAALAGVVEEAGRDAVMGNYVLVYSPEHSTRIWYMHMRAAPLVEDGERVDTGESLGAVGSTGRSDGPHLHFQMQMPVGFVDPYPALSLARARAGIGGIVGDEGDEERQAWADLEAIVNAATERARVYRWPDAMLDAFPEGSETRSQMRQVREEYQRAVRTYVDAYKAWRARGDLAGAARAATGAFNVDQHMHRFRLVQEQAAQRTLLENITAMTVSAEADLRAAANRVVEAGTNIGLGIGIVLVGAAFAYATMNGRRRR